MSRPVPLGPLDTSASELQSLQQMDESLETVRQTVKGKLNPTADSGSFEQEACHTAGGAHHSLSTSLLGERWWEMQNQVRVGSPM